MVIQKLTIRLDETELPEIRMVSGDIGREIQIEVYVREDSETPIDLETYSADITLIKPDNTFIMDHFNVDKYELPENAGAVSGSGYYQIKIYTAGTHQIYTGQGRFLVDDMILSDDVIESSSIAFGDRFPEDFATKEWVDDEIEAAGIGTYVAGNPAGEETMPPLVRLQINDDIYPLIHKIEEQEDADITAPADGDVLIYDADDQKWKNEPLVIPDPTVTKTVTGNPIEFSDGADAPLVKCVTQITGYQSGSGTPSPDNIRPIVAYTEGEIEVGGKNMFHGASNYSCWSDSGNIRISHNANNRLIGKGIKVSQGVTYTITFPTTFKIASMFYYEYSSIDEVSVITNNTLISVENNTGVYTFTATKTEYLYLYFAPINISQSVTEADLVNTQFEKGSTATTYEPYISPTHTTTTYPSAIYRGSEDCVNGEVTSEMSVIDLGDLSWDYNASAKTFYCTLPTSKKYTASEIANAISEYFECIPNNSLMSDDTLDCKLSIHSQGSNNWFNIRWLQYTIVADFKTAVTGVKLAYELATPTTSSVTPTNLPIKSLSGYSHIESSTGDMEVEYITETYDAITAAPKAEYHKLISSSIAVPADPGIVVTLPESIYSYDELVITADPDSVYSGSYSTQQAVLTRPLEVGKKYLFNMAPGVNMVIYFEVTSKTQLTFLRGWQAYEYTITDLTGIKWR